MWHPFIAFQEVHVHWNGKEWQGYVGYAQGVRDAFSQSSKRKLGSRWLQETRGRWKALSSIAVAGWSGSAAVGGFLIETRWMWAVPNVSLMTTLKILKLRTAPASESLLSSRRILDWNMLGTCLDHTDLGMQGTCDLIWGASKPYRYQSCVSWLKETSGSRPFPDNGLGWAMSAKLICTDQQSWAWSHTFRYVDI